MRNHLAFNGPLPSPVTSSLRLSARSLHLPGLALCLLLACKTTTDLTGRGLGGGLRLLSLLLALLRGLLLLGFLDGGLTGSLTGFGTLCSALLDHVESGTDDGALVLDCAASSFLCDFLHYFVKSQCQPQKCSSFHIRSHAEILLFFRDFQATAGSGSTNLRNTLLVHSSVQHGPGYSSRVLALKEQGFGFAILESEDLAVTTDVEFAL